MNRVYIAFNRIDYSEEFSTAINNAEKNIDMMRKKLIVSLSVILLSLIAIDLALLPIDSTFVTVMKNLMIVSGPMLILGAFMLSATCTYNPVGSLKFAKKRSKDALDALNRLGYCGFSLDDFCVVSKFVIDYADQDYTANIRPVYYMVKGYDVFLSLGEKDLRIACYHDDIPDEVIIPNVNFDDYTYDEYALFINCNEYTLINYKDTDFFDKHDVIISYAIDKNGQVGPIIDSVVRAEIIDCSIEEGLKC